MASASRLHSAAPGFLPHRDARSLKEVLQETIHSWGWQDRIQRDAATGSDFVTTIYIRHGESFIYTLTVNEGRRRFGIHVNSPIQIPPGRKIEALLVANYFNTRSLTGAYYVTDTGDLCYQWMLFASLGAEPDIGAFKILRDDANKAFEQSFTPFLTAAFTASPAAEIISKFEFFRSKR